MEEKVLDKKDKLTSIDFEFINIEPINDYISECEIKVFYHGKNRNGSYISKAVGNQIANSLPRTPIVALYNEEIKDYRDHGEEITITSDGVKFEKKTVPFGAVDPNTPIVWHKITDNRGQEKEYLVVRGFLWTGRYPHLKKILDKPKGQSMEFFEESVEGNWANFDNEEEQVFIFNEADISALCILGDDVEPCFEDATVGVPEILYSLEKNEFTKEFNNFMFELDEVLKNDKKSEGGMEMKNEDDKAVEFASEAAEAVKKAEESKSKEDISAARKEVNALEDGEEKEALIVRLDKIEVKEEEKPEDDHSLEKEPIIEEEPVIEEDPIVDHEAESLAKDAIIKELEDNFSLVSEELEELKAQFSVIKEERDLKVAAEKEAICEKFEVLGEEVLKDFRENLNDYSVQELEKELSVIAFQKGITFSLLNKKDDIITSIPSKDIGSDVPAWLKAVEKQQSNN